MITVTNCLFIIISVTGAVLEEVEALNGVGSVVYRGTVKGASRHTIDMSGLANRHYMLRTTMDNGAVSQKFYVMK